MLFSFVGSVGILINITKAARDVFLARLIFWDNLKVVIKRVVLLVVVIHICEKQQITLTKVTIIWFCFM